MAELEASVDTEMVTLAVDTRVSEQVVSLGKAEEELPVP